MEKQAFLDPVIEAYLACTSVYIPKGKTLEEITEEARSAYVGKFDSREAFGMEMAQNLFDIPDSILWYFDFVKFANDLIGDGYMEDNGYYFSAY